MVGAPPAADAELLAAANLGEQLRRGHLAGFHTNADPRCPMCGHRTDTAPEPPAGTTDAGG